MTTEASDPNQYRLETEFQGEYVIHTRPDLPNVEEPHDQEAIDMVQGRWTSGDVIGTGGYGVVLKQKNDSGRLRAVKRVSRGALSAKQAGLSWELRVLAKLKDHPMSFVRFFGWYEDKYDIFLVMEFIENGDLSQYLKEFPQKVKDEARNITRQILEGLVVMHDQNICHRDLKPQNILITSTTSQIEIKITDFGISKQEQGTQLKTTCGTENYKAPELRRLLPTVPRRRRRKGEGPETYTNAVDIWSLGTLVHVLLTSELPFLLTLDENEDCTDTTVGSDDNYSEWEDEQDLDLLRDYCEKKEVFPVASLERSLVGESGIDFVTKLLTPEPQCRPSAANALKSPWIACYQRLVDFFSSRINLYQITEIQPHEFNQRILYTLSLKRAEHMMERLCSLGCPDNIAKDLSILILYNITFFTNQPDRAGRPSANIDRLVDALQDIANLSQTNKTPRPNSSMKTDDFIFQALHMIRWYHYKNIMLEREVRWDSKGYLYISITGVETSNTSRSYIYTPSEWVYIKSEWVYIKSVTGNHIGLQFSMVETSNLGEHLDKWQEELRGNSSMDCQIVSPQFPTDKTSEDYWTLMAKILLGSIVPEWKERKL